MIDALKNSLELVVSFLIHAAISSLFIIAVVSDRYHGFWLPALVSIFAVSFLRFLRYRRERVKFFFIGVFLGSLAVPVFFSVLDWTVGGNDGPSSVGFYFRAIGYLIGPGTPSLAAFMVLLLVALSLMGFYLARWVREMGRHSDRPAQEPGPNQSREDR